MHYFQLIDKQDIDYLIDYLNELSEESKKRFGPHPFTREAIADMLDKRSEYFLFSSRIGGNNSIISYCVTKRGWLSFEHQRLKNYGLAPNEGDFTIAPSVADTWQGKGLGTSFLDYIIKYSANRLNAKRLILWGGVQSDNIKAIKMYQRFGFTKLGEFEYYGKNYDMMLEIL